MQNETLSTVAGISTETSDKFTNDWQNKLLSSSVYESYKNTFLILY